MLKNILKTKNLVINLNILDTQGQTSGSKHNQNNQPVETESLIVLHNGIITNYKHLNKKYSFDRNTELDTYVINELFELF